MRAWLQVQEGVELKASDLVQFVLQTDTRSKERQAARIKRLKVAPPHHTSQSTFICTAFQKRFCLSHMRPSIDDLCLAGNAHNHACSVYFTCQPNTHTKKQIATTAKHMLHMPQSAHLKE